MVGTVTVAIDHAQRLQSDRVCHNSYRDHDRTLDTGINHAKNAFVFVIFIILY